MAALWAYRERLTEAIATTGIPHKVDVAVPIPELGAFCAELKGVVRDAATRTGQRRAARHRVRAPRRRQPARQCARPGSGRHGCGRGDRQAGGGTRRLRRRRARRRQGQDRLACLLQIRRGDSSHAVDQIGARSGRPAQSRRPVPRVEKYNSNVPPPALFEGRGHVAVCSESRLQPALFRSGTLN